MKAIALLARGRSQLMPELATAQEQGLADFEANAWSGLFLPERHAGGDRVEAQSCGGRSDGQQGPPGSHARARCDAGQRRPPLAPIFADARRAGDSEVGAAHQGSRHLCRLITSIP